MLFVVFLVTGFCFTEEQKLFCGRWSAVVYNSVGDGKIGVDTLTLYRNGKFSLRKYSVITLPGLYTGKWQLNKDSLQLTADAGGMLMFNTKGVEPPEKLKTPLLLKLSITIHSREEIYLSYERYNFRKLGK